MQEEKEREGIKRPYVDVKVACKVEQFAAKHGESDRDAYRQIINTVLDDEGNIQERIKKALQ